MSSVDAFIRVIPYRCYLLIDRYNDRILQKYGIRYVINLSVSCPQPDGVNQDGHFMRIPVNDSYQAKLLPHFDEAFKFLGKIF